MISKILSFGTKCFILLTLFKESSPDKNNIKSRYADLLSSLASVNGERMNALNKLFQLQNFDTARHTLRISGDDETKQEKPIIVVFNKKGAPKIVNEFSKGHINVPSRPDVDAIEDDKIHSKKKGVPFNNAKVLIPKYVEHMNQVDSSDEPPPSDDLTKTLKRLTSDIQAKEKIFGPNKLAWETCIDLDTAYYYCKDSCKDAVKDACSYYTCKDNLYYKLKRECGRTCDVDWSRKKRLNNNGHTKNDTENVGKNKTKNKNQNGQNKIHAYKKGVNDIELNQRNKKQTN